MEREGYLLLYCKVKNAFKIAFFHHRIRNIFTFIICLIAAPHLIADHLFKIDIKPVYIFSEADSKSEKIKALYQADDIHVISLNDKWANVSFLIGTETVAGWVEKIYLQSQVNETELENDTTLDVMDIAIDNTAKELSIEKSSKSELQCVETKEGNNINGCFVYIDLELKGAADLHFADVSCAVKFEVSSSSTKIITQEKKVRTPLKEGMGAVRLQVAMIPLFEKEVSAINLLSYHCTVEKMF